MDKRTKRALIDSFGLLLAIASGSTLVTAIFVPEVNLRSPMATGVISGVLFIVSFLIVTRDISNE